MILNSAVNFGYYCFKKFMGAKVLFAHQYLAKLMPNWSAELFYKTTHVKLSSVVIISSPGLLVNLLRHRLKFVEDKV